jgi:Ran GTPase-activating protein (RanGAP) involved in mRNA processing and transport
MSSLHPSLLRNASLTSLQLSHNYLGPDALQSFGHILCANNALRSLQLDNCYVCGKDGRARHGMHHLADSLTEVRASATADGAPASRCFSLLQRHSIVSSYDAVIHRTRA